MNVVIRHNSCRLQLIELPYKDSKIHLYLQAMGQFGESFETVLRQF